MLSPVAVIGILLLYMSGLFLASNWVRRRQGARWADGPVVYSLSLAVYCTAWAFYGTIGQAVYGGMMFMAVYLGAMLSAVLWWFVLRRMVRIKNAFGITSIADFISARYDKSQGLAILATCAALVCIMPYIALQLKAVLSTFSLIVLPANVSAKAQQGAGLGIVSLMILFTIVFGVRRLAPSQRHENMLVVLAVQNLIKLAAFLAAGIFVTYFLFHGFGDIFTRLAQSPFRALTGIVGTAPGASPFLTWTVYIFMSMSAVLFLPRQFHLAVVENSDEKHIRTAMWMFPLYMLLINIFVFPVAAGGLLQGGNPRNADVFLLKLPLDSGHYWLALLVFLGGFSAAAGMIMVEAMTLSTMLSNHLLLPLADKIRALSFLRRHILKCRWLAVAVVLLLGYWYELRVSGTNILVNIGMISFAGVTQFTPAILGGMYWRRGNKIGALLGLSAGMAVWMYTLLIPAILMNQGINAPWMETGPWGMAFLKPTRLFGLTGLDPVSHGAFWSLLFNLGLYVLGSIYFRQSVEEQRLSEQYVGILNLNSISARIMPNEPFIDLADKEVKIEMFLSQYYPEPRIKEITLHCLKTAGVAGKQWIHSGELVALHAAVEKILAGSIGAASARKAMRAGDIFTPSEVRNLSEMYARILSELKVTPEELRKKIDFHQERERLLSLHAGELEDKVRERDEQIFERKRAEKALRESERRLMYIIDFLPDATFVIDKEGEVIAWNHAMEILTGVASVHMLGKGDYEYAKAFYNERRPMLIDLLEESPEIVRARYTQVSKNPDGTLMGEAVFHHPKNGELFYYGKAAPLYDSAGNRVGAIETVRDITREKKAEAALTESEAKYRAIFENSGTALISIDEDTTISMCNKEFEKLSGYAKAEIEGNIRWPQFVVDSDDLTRMMDYHHRRRQEDEGLPYTYEFKCRDRQGQLRDVVASVVMLPGTRQTLAALSDITERKRTEAELREYRHHLEDLVRERTVELTQAKEAVESQFAQLQNEIAERKRAEENKIELERQLYQAQKMESIGRLAAGIAHEINTPMQFVGDNNRFIQESFAALLDFFRKIGTLARKGMTAENKDEAIHEIAGAAADSDLDYLRAEIPKALQETSEGIRRVTDIVRAMKEFSHPDQGRKIFANINRNIETTVLVARNEWKYVAEMRTDLDPDLKDVLCFPDFINQVLLNLIVNAAQTIAEKVALHPGYKGVITLSTRQKECCVEIKISDTGMGIPPKHHSRIFDPFFTTKEVGKGTGQGLSLVYGIIVKKHEGTISFETAENQGTTFIICLPNGKQKITE